MLTPRIMAKLGMISQKAEGSPWDVSDSEAKLIMDKGSSENASTQTLFPRI